MVNRLPALALAIGLATTVAARAQEGAPLSAIDWLSNSVAIPAALPAEPARPAEPPVADNALPGDVTVRSLDVPPVDEVGLFSAASRGLPEDLWSRSTFHDVAGALSAARIPKLDATQILLHDLLSVRADPPVGAAAGDGFLLARVDALMDAGDLAAARSLLDLAGRTEPRNFRRWFDISLLTGQENGACSAMRRLPQVTPTYPARVFCLARGGDWRAAALTLESGTSLGVIDPAEAERLRLFLDDQADPATLPPPSTPSPLDFAIYAAIGEPLRTARLPLAFSHADLRPINGWKTRLDAAERLARAGAIPVDRLWDIYHEREPAASGGLWDRVDAVQRLDAAIEADDAALIGAALPEAWTEMLAAGLAPALARRHAAALREPSLWTEAPEVAAEMRALSDPGAAPTPLPPFMTAIGRDDAPEATDLELAIANGLGTAEIDATGRALLDEGRIGEAALHAIALLEDGAEGNLDAVRDGLALLRAAKLEDRARAAAVELTILGPGA